MRQIKQICVLTAFILVFLPLTVFAGNISMDGNFDDWDDKPSLGDNSGDEGAASDISLVRWYPDLQSSKMYFYCERLSGFNESKPNQFEDWDVEMYFDSDGLAGKAVIEYHPPSNKVQVTVYDKNGGYLWGGKGKWGDNKEPGRRMEFYIPVSYLASSMQSGYQVDFYFASGSDRVPDNGSITASTISTFPFETVSGVIVICVLIFALYKLKGRAAKRG